jgi:hypothetical protein
VRRFARPISEAGSIAPRSTDGADDAPRSHPTFARLVGAAGMVGLTAVLFWLLTDPTFRVTAANVELQGLQYADEAAVRARLAGLERAPNAFRVRGSELVAQLTSLPEVVAADAIVTLPASVSVRVRERVPIFIWSDTARDWLVDRDGRLFAPVAVPDASALQAPDEGAGAASSADPASSLAGGPGPGVDPAEGAAASDPAQGGSAPSAPAVLDAVSPRRQAIEARLPRVVDTRSTSVSADGSRLSSIDLAVMRQLLALTPDDVGSPGSTLSLNVTDDSGYVLESDPWQAIFGIYTPRLQGPEAVPRQVQCLRWLLADPDRNVSQVRLAVSGDLCGTYVDFDTDSGKRARRPSP